MNFHGGNVHQYLKKNLFDFSSNINPLGIPEGFKRALIENIQQFTLYPDIDYTELRKNIANYLQIEDMNKIIVGNGAVELIYKGIAAANCEKIITIGPTFSEYERAALQHQYPFYEVEALDLENMVFNEEILLRKVTPRSLVVLCNPNNPTGLLIPKAQMYSILQRLSEKNCTLLIDEAFMEFTDDYPKHSMLDVIDEFDNLFIVKAATKFFGMPGIRLGYGISSNQKLLHRIKNSLEPWNINTAAVLAGCTIFQDEQYIEKSRQWIQEERKYVFDGLSRIKALKVHPSQANYYLLKVIDETIDAWKLKDLLLKKDILIRTPDGFNYLSPYHFRIAVKDRKANEVLLRALEDLFRSKP